MTKNYNSIRKVTDAFIQLKDLSGKTIFSQQTVLKQGTNIVNWSHLAELQKEFMF
jgi:hypothetical protein